MAMEVTNRTVVDPAGAGRVVICPRCGREVDILQIVDAGPWRGEPEDIRCELCELEETEGKRE